MVTSDGATMDLRHDGRGDQLAFGREGASIFEAPEPIPELKRLRRALAHGAHAADPGGLARHEAEMTDDRDLLVREQPAPFRRRGWSAPHRRPPVIAAKAVRRISSAVTASAKPSAAVTKTRCEPSRTRATLAARQTTISTPAASAAAASSAVSAVT